MDEMFNKLSERYEQEAEKSKPLEERRDEIKESLATGDEEKARLKVSVVRLSFTKTWWTECTAMHEFRMSFLCGQRSVLR